MTAMVKTMIYCILLHLRSNVGVNSKGQSLGNLYQGLCLLLIKLEHKVFLNSMVLTKSRNWSQIPTQWWKLSGKNAP